MKIPVRLYEVERSTPGGKPKLVRDFQVVAPRIEQCRKMVTDKVRGEGYEIRALSVSPDPKPSGSILVYVWTKDVAALRKTAETKRRQRR